MTTQTMTSSSKRANSAQNTGFLSPTELIVLFFAKANYVVQVAVTNGATAEAIRVFGMSHIVKSINVQQKVATCRRPTYLIRACI